MSNDQKKKKNINILPIIITHRSTMAGMGPIPILSTTVIIIITQTAAIALEPLTTHPDEWAEPSHK